MPTHEHHPRMLAWFRQHARLVTFDTGIAQLLASLRERAKHSSVLGASA